MGISKIYIMTTKVKGLLSLGVLAVTLTIVSLSGSKTHANNRVFKYRVKHNGHYICIPEPGMRAHLKEHIGNFTCELAGYCDDANNPLPMGD